MPRLIVAEDARHDQNALSSMNRRSVMMGTLGLLSGCAVALPLRTKSFAQDSSATPVSGGEIRFTLGASTTLRLNVIGSQAGSFLLGSTVYNGLVTSSPDWESVEPALAESWDISEDGLTYTFHLRQGVNWHDGDEFSAEDVQFTYQTLLNPAVASFFAADLLVVSGAQAYVDGTATEVEGIKIIDDFTISFTLDAPNAAFISSTLTYHVIIPKHFWESVSVEDIVKPETWEAGQIGTGPFKYSDYEPDRFLELVRNDEFWRGAPYLDRLLFVHLGTNPGANVAALESGEIDFTPIPGNEYDRIKSVPGLVVEVKPILNVRALSFNVTKPYLSDKRIRQAIAYGIDRRGIVEEILGVIATYTDSVTPSKTWVNPSLPSYDYDPDKARALLAEAGWDSAQAIELSLYYTDQPNKDAIAYVQQQLADIGIDASIIQLDGASVQPYYFEERSFDILLYGAGVSSDFDEFADFFSTNTGSSAENAMHYSNPRVDELFALGRGTVNFEERRNYYNEIQEILAEELPWIPLYTLNLVAGYNDRVHGGESFFFPWNRPYNWNIEKTWVST